MAITTIFGSIGFVARFILAFVIIAYVYSQNREDASVRRGFVLLCALGVAVFVVGILIFFGVIAFSGATLIGNALTNFHYHHYF